MKILVTGATSFIGVALCRSLCKDGHEVLAFHMMSSSDTPLADVPVRHIAGNLQDREAVFSAMEEKPDAIFHLGSMLTSIRSQNRMMEVNVRGTRHILQAALKNEVEKVVVLSNAYTLGVPERPQNNDIIPSLINENHCWNLPESMWPYSWSKYQAEREVQLAVSHQQHVVIVNPTMVIGEGEYAHRSSSFFVKFQQAPPHYIINGGLNLIDEQDVVQGLKNALTYGEKGQRYILGGTNISYRELISDLSGIMGFSNPYLTLPNVVAQTFFNWKYQSAEFSSSTILETELFKAPGAFFYYDTKKAQLGLHLPPAEHIHTSLERTWKWFSQSGKA